MAHVEDFGATGDYASFRLIGDISGGWTFAIHIGHD
jgi:hypothetical protein